MPLKRLSSSPSSIGGMSRQITLKTPGGRNSTDGGNLLPSPAIVTWASIRALSGMELDRATLVARKRITSYASPTSSSVTADMMVRL